MQHQNLNWKVFQQQQKLEGEAPLMTDPPPTSSITLLKKSEGVMKIFPQRMYHSVSNLNNHKAECMKAPAPLQCICHI